MDRFGVFAENDLSKKEKDIFAEYLQRSLNSPALEFIIYFLEDNYLKFIDILAGTTFKIPSHKTLEKDIERIQIYTYALSREFSKESIRSVGKMYNKNSTQTRRIISRVAKVLGTEDLLEGQALDNFQKNIKEELNEPIIEVGGEDSDSYSISFEDDEFVGDIDGEEDSDSLIDD